MMTAAQALKTIYELAMEEAIGECRGSGYHLHEAARAQLEARLYAGVHEEALELMQENDDDILCVLVTGDVCRQVGDHEVQWSTVDLKAMN